MPAAGRSRLCPVCVRPTVEGTCAEHGPWQSHQLATSADRAAAARAAWLPFEPLLHACPRCLGDVAEGRRGFECVAHAHGRDPHGPFQVDELLGVTAQREAATARSLLARRAGARRRPRPVAPSLSLPPPDMRRVARLAAAASVVAATFAFLSR